MANIYLRSTDGNDADSGATWALAKATLAGALAIATNADTIWVSQAHAETTGAAHIQLTFPTTPGLKVLCGNDAAQPPTALAATATVTTTGNFGVQYLGGHAYVYGVTFSSGTGNSGSADLLLGSSNALSIGLYLDTCPLKIVSTSTQALLTVGPANQGEDCIVKLVNCPVSFGNSSQVIELNNARLEIEGMSFDAGSVATTTTLFTFGGSNESPCFAKVRGCDFSAKTVTSIVDVSNTNYGQINLQNIKMGTFTNFVTGTSPGPGGPIAEFYNVSSSDTNYSIRRYEYGSSAIEETTIVRTGGASDGTTAWSMKMVSSANTKFWAPFYSPTQHYRQETVGGAITVTVEVVTDNVTLTDAEAWLEVEYLGTSGFPKSTIVTDRAADVLATPANQTASAAAWTTTGLTTPVTQKFAVTFTPQEKGVLSWRVALAKASTTMYVDAVPTVS